MFWEYCSFSGLNQKHEYSQTNVLANGCLFMHTSIKGIQLLKIITQKKMIWHTASDKVYIFLFNNVNGLSLSVEFLGVDSSVSSRRFTPGFEDSTYLGRTVMRHADLSRRTSSSDKSPPVDFSWPLSLYCFRIETTLI